MTIQPKNTVGELVAERDRMRKSLAMYQFADRWTPEERQEMRFLLIAIGNISEKIARFEFGEMTEDARAIVIRNRFSDMPTVADAVQQIKEFYENRDRQKPR